MNFYILIFKNKMSAKKFSLWILICTVFFINSIALINYIIDPMWIFSHKNYFDVKKIDFDERQQKTNYLYYQDNSFQNIILGSSRTTYLNKDIFSNNIGSTFNYSANAMDLYEYDFFINNFYRLVGQHPKNIILGIDFFGANKNKNYKISESKHLSNSKQFFYRLKVLYSSDTLKYSILNIKESTRNKKEFYNSNYIKINNSKKSKETTLKDFIPFSYDTNMLNYYQNLKSKYGKSNFIIFTPPVSIEQLVRNHKNKLDEDYFRWLRELVHVFGSIYHFMYPSMFSKNYDNFYDANHFHHKSGKILAIDILNGINNNDMKQGIILNKDNIENFIYNYQKRLDIEE